MIKRLLLLMMIPCILPASVVTMAKDSYTLTYPDGSTVQAETYDEAKHLENEWKELFSSTTDKDGNINLEGWAQKGEIIIEESKVPEGYTAKETVTYSDLSDKNITIVNEKIEEPTETTTPTESIVETENPVEEATEASTEIPTENNETLFEEKSVLTKDGISYPTNDDITKKQSPNTGDKLSSAPFIIAAASIIVGVITSVIALNRKRRDEK